jgi:hypothetical protein
MHHGIAGESGGVEYPQVWTLFLSLIHKLATGHPAHQNVSEQQRNILPRRLGVSSFKPRQTLAEFKWHTREKERARAMGAAQPP